MQGHTNVKIKSISMKTNLLMKWNRASGLNVVYLYTVLQKTDCAQHKTDSEVAIPVVCLNYMVR